MDKSRLLEALKTLEKEEIREFRKFLDSPLYNQREDVRSLYEEIILRSERRSSIFHKAEIFKSIAPGEEFDDRKMRHIMSFLFTALKKYFVYREVEKDSGASALYLTRAFRKRELEKDFFKTLEDSRKDLLQDEIRDLDFHKVQYGLHLEQYEFEHKKQRGASNLQQLSDSLSSYFIASYLRQICLQLSHQSVEDASYKQGMLPNLLAYLATQKLTGTPAVAIYYYAYKALTDNENTYYFNRLKEGLQSMGHHFSQQELLDIYLLAINYCIKKINVGDSDYLREAFELYRGGIKRKVFVQNGIFSRWTYNNILMAGTALGEWEWVESFLLDYKEYLDPKEKLNTFNYNMAIFQYRKGNYPKAMDLLQQVEIKETFQNLDIRRMLLKMYYESGEFMALESLLDSFKIYIYRHREIGYHKENYLNLIRFTKKLLQSDLTFNSKNAALRLEIEATSAVAEKDWLLDQLDSKSLLNG